MTFLIGTDDNKSGYHRHRPLTGRWTGWEDTVEKANTAPLEFREPKFKTVADYINEKALCKQIIKSITIKNKQYSLQEFTNSYPEYFV